MTVAIVGDVKATEIIPIIEKYFGRIPAGPKPAPLRTQEPKQLAEKVVLSGGKKSAKLYRRYSGYPGGLT